MEVHRHLEVAMCHWSSRDYERRLSADPGRSFFAALRDLFRRHRRQQVRPPEVLAEVIPLRPEAAGRRPERSTERADAA
jgi:hypothetical protein